LFLGAMAVAFAGYALFGRSFAYLGVQPVYVGEMLLVLAALVVLRTARRRWEPTELLVVVFMLWGLARTLPFIERDGIDAPRDGVVWGYAMFALAISAIARAEHIERLRRHFTFLIPFFLIWVCVSALIALMPTLPLIPGTNIAIVQFKGGDMGVHLAGVIAFLIVGLVPASTTASSLVAVVLLPLWLIALAVVGSLNRGGLFAGLSGWTAALFLHPPGRWWTSIVAGAVVFTGVIIVDPELDVGRVRAVSVDQVVTNFVSVLFKTGDDKLDATKEFRLRWWSDILDYTFKGPYFWTGKGFGVNLADDDGYQVKSDGSLRAPHNTHLTILARMGVPGLVMWVLMQLVFVLGLVQAFFASRRIGAVFWCRVDAWIFAYWVAMLLNTSFDPYLEGPQGGIPFWVIFGLGLAAMRAQRGLSRTTGVARSS
jgi:hypothetical protein